MKSISKNPLIGVVLFAFLLASSLSIAQKRYSVDEAFTIIADAFSKQRPGDEQQHRKVSFSDNDWSDGPFTFIKVERDNIPILSQASLSTPRLQIHGLTKKGEVLQLIDQARIIHLRNPLGRDVDQNGTWYKVRLLDKREGWIFAIPSGYENSPFVSSFSKVRAQKPIVQNAQNKKEDNFLSVLAGVFVLLVGLIILIHGLKQQSSAPVYSSSDHDSDYSGGSDHVQEEQKPGAEWPWRDKEVIVGDRNIHEKGFFGNTKVGHVEKDFWGDDRIHKEGIFTSDDVGKVERDFWGTPTSISDNEGNKVGDIKTTFWGDKIITDEDGNKIGDYKGD